VVPVQLEVQQNHQPEFAAVCVILEVGSGGGGIMIPSDRGKEDAVIRRILEELERLKEENRELREKVRRLIADLGG
jgi:aromatic ring hydroxylase